ncbi:hypothetical protein [Salmonella enterica]|nr:hypothetical protein [Salmonella enterica subsp. salamae]ECG8610358.1 hypothetical protein [Salmonella enterica subsp. salamae]HCL5075145.1 hypothetical protein [Salmonella enterica]
MDIVYFLYHLRDEGTKDEDVKLIGIYTSHDLALNAQKKLMAQPGFIDYPHGFKIVNIELNRDSWVEGFVTRPGRG